MVFVVYTVAMGIVIGVMVGDKEVVEDDDEIDDDRTSSVGTFVEAQSLSHSLPSPPLWSSLLVIIIFFIFSCCSFQRLRRFFTYKILSSVRFINTYYTPDSKKCTLLYVENWSDASKDSACIREIIVIMAAIMRWWRLDMAYNDTLLNEWIEQNTYALFVWQSTDRCDCFRDTKLFTIL